MERMGTLLVVVRIKEAANCILAVVHIQEEANCILMAVGSHRMHLVVNLIELEVVHIQVVELHKVAALMQEVILRLLDILVEVHSPAVDINISRAMEDNQDIMVDKTQ